MKFAMLTLLFSFTLTTNADAPRADARQVAQAARIRAGVQSGELNRAEAHRMRAGQRHVKRLEKKANADGEVTAAEKARLEKAQDIQSKRIYTQKHDDQVRDSNAPDAAPQGE